MKTVDEIVTDLPRDEQVIVKRLRSLIRECLPKATEKNSYGTCFYSHHRMMVFIWPPSIYWGKKKFTLKEKGVTLGFCQGNKMSGVLLAEGRKQIYSMYFRSLGEINDDQVRSLLYEAELVDDSFARSGRKH